MKNRMKWMMLAVVVVVVSSVWAEITPWDPNDPNDLKFLLNFEDNFNATTTYARGWATAGPPFEKYNLTGTLMNFKPDCDAWEGDIPDRKIGTNSGDFRFYNDINPWGAPNDCRVSVNPNGWECLNFGDSTVKRTWTFWFYEMDHNDSNVPQSILNDETCFLRHTHKGATPTFFWDMYIKNTKLCFRNNVTGAKMQFQTKSSMAGLGVDPNEWHHAAFVIDRTTLTGSKIYIDGLPVEVEYGTLPKDLASGNVNTINNDSPMSVGAVATTVVPWRIEGEMDGMLDEIRVYHKDLSPIEVSIVYQTDGTVRPIALYPVPSCNEVPISVDLEWKPAAGAATQDVYFADDPAINDIHLTGNGAMKIVKNRDSNPAAPPIEPNISGPLRINTTYYWKVNANVVAGPDWHFTTITGKAADPTPKDEKQGVNFGRVELAWDAPDANNFDVYFGTASNPTVQVANHNVIIDGDPNWVVTAPTPGVTYYWKVVSFYPHGLSATSNVWKFRTAAYPIVFNTSKTAVTYTSVFPSQSIPAYNCKVYTGSWDVVGTGVLDACVAVINFNNFDYNDRYDIIVIPEYTSGTDDSARPTPLVINVVDGNFYFDGTMDISGTGGGVYNASADRIDRDISPIARCGGHRGPRKEITAGEAGPELLAGYYNIAYEFETRYGTQQNHYYATPTTINTTYGSGHTVSPSNPPPVLHPELPSGYDVFGLGCPLTPPYKNSGGGGYGGIGGDSGRGYQHGIFAGGATYGDEEIPIPFGGSAAGWAQTAPGSSGGGGVEINVKRTTHATGNIKLGTHAKILANGGSATQYVCQYPAGGGSGGSVKLVADSNVTIEAGALISVNGGKGGDGNEKGNNTGGGGGGGRVAIFYGNTYTPNGTITADGGAKGVIKDSLTYPLHNDKGLSFDGEDGTIYIVDSDVVSVRKASAPTPRDGDYMVYAPGPTNITLKWYSGYNATDACDQVYCDTNPNPTTAVGVPVPAKRGQHSSTITMAVSPGVTYNMKVQTTNKPGGTAFTPVDSDVWTFKTVDWRCLEPNWPAGQHYNPPQYYDSNYPPVPPIYQDPNMAGRQAWDINHDCVVTDVDFWFWAQHWQIDRGGFTYRLDLSDLDMYTSEWMTCRARVKNADESKCIGWPLTPDWVPADEAPL